MFLLLWYVVAPTVKIYIAKVAPTSPSDQPGRAYVRTRVTKVAEGFDVMSGNSSESEIWFASLSRLV